LYGDSLLLLKGANAWKQHGPGKFGDKQVSIGKEVHADLEMWRWCVRNNSTLSTPIVTHIKRQPIQTWLSDASFEAIGGCCVESGIWWRFNLTQEMMTRVQKEAHKGRAQMLLNINILELLGMVMTAYVIVVQLHMQPEFDGDLVLLRGDNKSAVHWVNKAGGARDPRAGALMRLFGVVEMSSSWCFKANYIKGSDNSIADTISRGNYSDVSSRLTALYPHVHWQEVTLSQETLLIITRALASNWQQQHWAQELWSHIATISTTGVTSATEQIDLTI
jgi:hypothetical protein